MGPRVPSGFWLSVNPSLSKSTMSCTMKQKERRKEQGNVSATRKRKCNFPLDMKKRSERQTHSSEVSKSRDSSGSHRADSEQKALRELVRWRAMFLAAVPNVHRRSPKWDAFVVNVADMMSRNIVALSHRMSCRWRCSAALHRLR